MIVWYRTKAKIGHLLTNSSSSRRTARESACRLPYEMVEMVIAYVTDDLNTLKACSLTCRSWYTIVLSHVHHTLLLSDSRPRTSRGELLPLYKLYGLGLTPFIKEIRVGQRDRYWLVPGAFSPSSLRYFSALANVQAVRIQGLDTHLFEPSIFQYSKRFPPGLRSLTLYHPTCGPRQLLRLLPLFPNLQEIEVWWDPVYLPYLSSTVIPHTELVPPIASRLRGRLSPCGPIGAETLVDFIASSIYRQFCHIDAYGIASHAPYLVRESAETLETLRFYATDTYIRKPFRMGPTD